jgi:hypothetical protein
MRPASPSAAQRASPRATTVGVASTPVMAATCRMRTSKRMPAPLQQHRSTPRVPAATPARSARSIDDLKPPMWICCPMINSHRSPSAPL